MTSRSFGFSASNLQESRVWSRSWLSCRAGRTERGWQVHSVEVDCRWTDSDRWNCAPTLASAHWALPSGLCSSLFSSDLWSHDHNYVYAHFFFACSSTCKNNSICVSQPSTGCSKSTQTSKIVTSCGGTLANMDLVVSNRFVARFITLKIWCVWLLI